VEEQAGGRDKVKASTGMEVAPRTAAPAPKRSTAPGRCDTIALPLFVTPLLSLGAQVFRERAGKQIVVAKFVDGVNQELPPYCCPTLHPTVGPLSAAALTARGAAQALGSVMLDLRTCSFEVRTKPCRASAPSARAVLPWR
jgi:hypothetical protein